MTTIDLFTHLSDSEILDEVNRLVHGERHATARLIAALAELDARRLYLAQGCSSLFVYCRRVLHLSEHAAYGRIEAARAARKFPILLEMLAAGDLTLTVVGLLAPHLTGDNCQGVLVRANQRTKHEAEEIVAALRSLPDVKTLVRKLPADATKPVDDNIELRCRAHNQYEADLFFGALVVRERCAVFDVPFGCPSNGHKLARSGPSSRERSWLSISSPTSPTRAKLPPSTLRLKEVSRRCVQSCSRCYAQPRPVQ